MSVRIVGGALGGRRIEAPKGTATRPTSERVREAIASALEARGRVEGAHVLDLFAGTGAMGFEMLSRGASSALLVDRDRRAVQGIARSASELKLRQARTLCFDLLGDRRAVSRRLMDASRKAGHGPWSLVLVDPPYAEIERVLPLLSSLRETGATAPDALFVIEHATRNELELPSRLAPVASYRYGDTSVALVQSMESQ